MRFCVYACSRVVPRCGGSATSVCSQFSSTYLASYKERVPGELVLIELQATFDKLRRSGAQCFLIVSLVNGEGEEEGGVLHLLLLLRQVDRFVANHIFFWLILSGIFLSDFDSVVHPSTFHLLATPLLFTLKIV